MKNRDLQSKYNKVYKEGAYETFFTFNSFPHWKLILDMMADWQGLKVLEIGCGEGRLAAMINFAGARKVDAVDYSSVAIDIARNHFNMENVSFICDDYRNISKRYDVVVLDGVLEHLDNPFDELSYIMESNLNPGGTVICQCPSFINPRGYVWMTLKLLFDVPMSLTDLHCLCPFDFREFCQQHGYTVIIKSAHQDWAKGRRMIFDLRKRLKNALTDAGMDHSKIDALLEWLRKAGHYHQSDDFSGAVAVYKIEKG